MVVSTPQKGFLFLIGGAEDRKGDKRLLRQLLTHTQAENIVVIPTASAYPNDVRRNYCHAFRDLGLPGIQCLDIRFEDEADRVDNFEVIERADMVYFGGGDQVKLVRTLGRTRLFDLIRSRYETGELHIAGTSAGAAAAGNPMIYDGDREGLRKGAINYSAGFGLVDGVAIDTHFSARRRMTRLSQFLISGGCEKGIGLDEDTGIMVYPNLKFEVFGTGMVTVLNSGHVTGSNYDAIASGEKLRFNNMRVGFLPAGTKFSIKKWSILNRS